MINDDKLESIIQGFINVGPLFKKKLMRKDPGFSNDCFNHSHFQIMAVLKESGKQSISEVAKKLLISTPNMTKLLNKLIEENVVERFHDNKDRRVINIDLTENGHKYLDDKFDFLKSSMKRRLSTLSDEQLDQILISLDNLNSILIEISSED